MGDETGAALDIARSLVTAGVPVFRAALHTPDCAYPHCREEPGSPAEFHHPGGWQTTRAGDLSGIDAWRPGDALCAVMGHVCDTIDVDPRNGGDVSADAMRAAGLFPRAYGIAETPSGGTHHLIAPLGVAKTSPAAGVDLQAGAPDGTGRGFVYIAPTVRRSKVTGAPRAYRWTVVPDLSDTDGDDTGEALRSLAAQQERRPHVPAAVARPDDPFGPPDDACTPETAARICREAVERFRGMTDRDHNFNATLNNAAMTTGHHVPSFLSYQQAQDWLFEAAVHNGSVSYQGARAVRDTIRSGLFAGMRTPRTRRPEPAPEGSSDEETNAPDQGGKRSESVGETVDASSWLALDLGPFLDGTHRPAEPEFFTREDGVCLLYPGLVHSFHGESESGKSLAAQYESARLITAGRDVLYIDFESDAATVVPRLLALGAGADQIKRHLSYVRPDTRPSATESDKIAYEALLERPYALAVLDGVTEGMGVFGVESSNNNDQVTLWVRYFPKRIATVTGAAVVLIDHVTKAVDNRGRFAIGAQAKMAALDGAGYLIEVRKALGRGMRGAIGIRVGKDRPGAVRPHGGEFDPRDRTQEIAYMVIDSTGEDGRIRVQVRAPMPELDVPKLAPLMEEVSAYLERRESAGEGPASMREIVANVTGRTKDMMPACNELAKNGYIRIDVGARNAHMHSWIMAYRVADQDQT